MYRGKAAKTLKGIDIGDTVSLSKGGKTFQGTLMPRNELADDEHVVLKLDSGYNIGILIDEKTKIKVVKKAKPKGVTTAEKIVTDSNLPTITILGTGGTIASKIDYKTGAVAPAFSAQELHTAIPELSTIANIKTRMLFNILSENMTPKSWKAIAKAVTEELNSGSAGVIIAHGTDTMGYTSAAISFMLQNLGKPVVLVGSQRSSDRPSSDSALNLLSACRVAVSDCSGVYVVMHESINDDYSSIHLGTKVRKMHTSRRDAFRSINTVPVGRVKENIEFATGIAPRNKGEIKVDDRLEEKVGLLKVYPGITPDIMEYFVDNYKGIVIEGTGLGHVPGELIPMLKTARERGVLVVMTSQTIYGRINMKVYATGRHLLENGVIPGGDMLPETALVKLMVALARFKNIKDVQNFMVSNIAGEISEVSRPDAFLR